MMTPIKFIETINNSDDYIKTIYYRGGCYQFYKILKCVFPNAKPYLIKTDFEVYDHIVTKINDKYYDINGEFIMSRGNDKTDEIPSYVKEWGFSKHKSFYKECPVCEEPVMFSFNEVREETL